MPCCCAMLLGHELGARARCPYAEEDNEHPAAGQRSWTPASLSAAQLCAVCLLVAVMLLRSFLPQLLHRQPAPGIIGLPCCRFPLRNLWGEEEAFG